MRLMFAYHLMALQSGTVGSAQDLYRYSVAGKALGHEVVIYGPPDSRSPFTHCLDLQSVDGLIFVFEWTTRLRAADELDFARFVTKVPRKRRVVIDSDGSYNDRISVNGDSNHPDEGASRLWTEVCDSLSDKICQPTLSPKRDNVRTFLFYGYPRPLASTVEARKKDYGMVYVGHSKFRWAAMQRVLKAIEPVRGNVGRLALVGHGWDALPEWAVPMKMETAFYTDHSYLRNLGIEIYPPIRFDQVIPWMGKALFNPVLLRPVFRHLGLVTPRLFETLAADTIPLFCMDAQPVQDLYGGAALDLILPAQDPEQKIMDIVRDPERYHAILNGIRRDLALNHSHVERLKQIIDIVES
jgi:hypothetical protein